MMTQNTIRHIRNARRRFFALRAYYHGVALAGLAECGRGYLVAHVTHGKGLVTYFPAASIRDESVIPPTLRHKLRGILGLYNPDKEFVCVVAGVVQGRKRTVTVYSVQRVTASNTSLV
jgi:hypothetical protein